MKTIELICCTCNKSFQRALVEHKKIAKRNPNYKPHCSKSCQGSPSLLVNCKNCNAPFIKRQCQIKRSANNFCSRSCSATYTNKHHPKKVGGYRNCPKCQRPFLKQKLPPNCFCVDCREDNKANLLYNRNPTKKEMVYEKHTHGAAYAYIRWHSRSVVLKDHAKVCSVCGYDKHAEVAHKRSISDFPDDAKLSEINHLSNLVLLCPNHHWEFDHQDLKLVSQEVVETSPMPL